MASTGAALRKPKHRRKVGAPPPPSDVQACVSRICGRSYEELGEELKGFTYSFSEKGDLYHWVDVLNHFDGFLEQCVNGRVLLVVPPKAAADKKGGDNSSLDSNLGQASKDGVTRAAGAAGGESSPSKSQIPTATVVAVLGAIGALLDNCQNKHIFNSIEHLDALLAAEDLTIVSAVLEALMAFVTGSLRVTGKRFQGMGALAGRLSELSRGWGTKEDGLGVFKCATPGGIDPEVERAGSCVHFTFYRDANGAAREDGTSGQAGLPAGVISFDIPNVSLSVETDSQIWNRVVKEHAVPADMHFTLLNHIRMARKFGSLEGRREFLYIRLLAFAIFQCCNPDQEELSTFLLHQPEWVNELVSLVFAEEAPENLRTAGLRALSCTYNRGRLPTMLNFRHSNVVSALTGGGQQGVLSVMVHKMVAALTTEDESAGIGMPYAEALVGLLLSLSATSTGCNALHESGILATLLPLLGNCGDQFIRLSTLILRVVEYLLDDQGTIARQFVDVGGLNALTSRLAKEIDLARPLCEAALKNDEQEGRIDPNSVDSIDSPVPYTRRHLLKCILRALTHAIANLPVSGNTRNADNEDCARLARHVKVIFDYSKYFGGGNFSLAATTVADMLHRDPTTFAVLDKAALPDAFLRSMERGILPSSEAISTIPGTLVALCLNNKGLDAVKKHHVLGKFVSVFTGKAYHKALQSDTPSVVGAGLDEVIRHVPTLQKEVIAIVLTILKAIYREGGSVQEENKEPLDVDQTHNVQPMDTEATENVAASASVVNDLPKNSGKPEESISQQTYVVSMFGNVVRLLEAMLANSTTSRIFVEVGGVDAVLDLYNMPGLTNTVFSHSISNTLAITFRPFFPQHAEAVCMSLQKCLRREFKEVDKLLVPETLDGKDGGKDKILLLRRMHVAESYLVLTSNLARHSSYVIGELLSGSDLLGVLTQAYQKAMWRLSYLDAAKSQTSKPVAQGETAGTSPSNDAKAAGATDSEPEAAAAASHGNEGSNAEPTGREAGEAGNHGANEDPGSFPATGLLDEMDVMNVDGGTDAPAGEVPGSLGGVASDEQDPRRVGKGGKSDAEDEGLTAFVSAGRNFYVSVSRSFVMPRRRDELAPTVSSSTKATAKNLAESLASLLTYTQAPYNPQVRESSPGKIATVGLEVVALQSYRRRVAEDLYNILFDRRRTCNNLLLNYLEKSAWLASLLETFESSMTHIWTFLSANDILNVSEKQAEGVLQSGEYSLLCYSAAALSNLLGWLSDSKNLLSTKWTAALLVYDRDEARPLARTSHDAAMLVRQMQSKIVHSIYRIWTHELLVHCVPEIVKCMFTVLIHCYAYKDEPDTSGNATAVPVRTQPPPPNPAVVAQIVEMGFSEARAVQALRHTSGSRSVDMALEWLFTHPEEEQTAADGGASVEDPADGLNTSEAATLEASPVPTKTRLEEESTSLALPPPTMVLECGYSLAIHTPGLAHMLADLLLAIGEGPEERQPAAVEFALQHFKDSCRPDNSGLTEEDKARLDTSAHTLALLLHNSADRIFGEVAQAGIGALCLLMLERYLESPEETTPKRIMSVMLILDSLGQERVIKPPKQGQAKALADLKGKAAAEVSDRVVLGASSEQQAKPRPEEGEGKTMAKESSRRLEKVLAEALGPFGGYLSDTESLKALQICVRFLEMELAPGALRTVITLLSRLTRNHKLAKFFLDSRGLELLLRIKDSSFYPAFEVGIATIVRHLLEDPITLRNAMEDDMRHMIGEMDGRWPGNVISPREFLATTYPLVRRSPAVFVEAVNSICVIDERRLAAGMPMIALRGSAETPQAGKEPRETKQNQASGAGTPSKHSKSKGKEKKSIAMDPGFLQVVQTILRAIAHDAPMDSGKLSVPPSEKEETKERIRSDVAVSEDRMAGAYDPNRTGSKRDASSALSFRSRCERVIFLLSLVTELSMFYPNVALALYKTDMDTSLDGSPNANQTLKHGNSMIHFVVKLLSLSHEANALGGSQRSFVRAIADRAAMLLVAICSRSPEVRKKVLTTLVGSLQDICCDPGDVSNDRKWQLLRPYIDVVNCIAGTAAAATTTTSQHTDREKFEVMKAMIDAKMIPALSKALQIANLNHPEAPKMVNAVLGPLERLTHVLCLGSGENRKSEKHTSTSVHPHSTIQDGQGERNAADARQGDVPGRRPADAADDVTMNDAMEEPRLRRDVGAASPAADAGLGMHDEIAMADGRPLVVPAMERDEAMHEAHEDAVHDFVSLAGLPGDEQDIIDEDVFEGRFGFDHGERAEDYDHAEDFQFAVEADEEVDEEVDDEDDEEEEADDEHVEEMDHEQEDDVEELDDEEEEEEEEDEEDADEDEDDDDDEGHNDWSWDGPGLNNDSDDFAEWRINDGNRVIEVRWGGGGARAGGQTGGRGDQHVSNVFFPPLIANSERRLGRGRGDASQHPFFRRTSVGNPLDPWLGLAGLSRLGEVRRASRLPGRGGADMVANHTQSMDEHPLLARPSGSDANGQTRDDRQEMMFSILTGALSPQLMLSGSPGMDFSETIRHAMADFGMPHASNPLYVVNNPTDSQSFSGWLMDESTGTWYQVRPGEAQQPLLALTIENPQALLQSATQLRENRLACWGAEVSPQGTVSGREFSAAVEVAFVQYMHETSPSPGDSRPRPPAGVTEEPQAAAAVQGPAEPPLDTQNTSAPGGTSNTAPATQDAPREVGSAEGSAEHAERMPEMVDRAGGDDPDVIMSDGGDSVAATAGGSTVYAPSVHSLEEGEQDMEERAAAEDLAGGVNESEDGGRADGDAGEGDGARASQDPSGAVGSESWPDGIDPTFLEALPPDLRAEIIATQVPAGQGRAHAQGAGTSTGGPASAAAGGVGAAGTSGRQSGDVGELDVEFLAALPPDIQAEVVAQQRAQRATEQAIQAAQHAQDMDNASILATFPAELREEVLLTSDESVLSTLPAPLVAEARLLRERALSSLGSRQRTAPEAREGGVRIPVGQQVPIEEMNWLTGRRHRHFEWNAGAPGTRHNGDPSHRLGSQRGQHLTLKELDGQPFVDSETMAVIVRLLQMSKPLAKGLLQRFLLNLCSNSVSRSELLHRMMFLLRPSQEEARGSSISPEDFAPFAMKGSGNDDQLYGQTCSAAKLLGQSSGCVPGLVSRRVLETMTFLARHHPSVSNCLIKLDSPTWKEGKLRLGKAQGNSTEINRKGKGKQVEPDPSMEVTAAKQSPVLLALRLLGLPLYERSTVHLEQALQLIEVVLKRMVQVVQTRMREKELQDSQKSQTQPTEAETAAANDAGGASHKDADVQTKASTAEKSAMFAPGGLDLLSHVQATELRQLAQILGRQNLSVVAFKRTAKVMELLAYLGASSASPSIKGGSEDNDQQKDNEIFDKMVAELCHIATELKDPVILELRQIEARCQRKAMKTNLSSPPVAGSGLFRILQTLYRLTLATARSKARGSVSDADRPASRAIWEEDLAEDSHVQSDGATRTTTAGAAAGGGHEARDATAGAIVVPKAVRGEMEKLSEHLIPQWDALSACMTSLEVYLEDSSFAWILKSNSSEVAGRSVTLPPGTTWILPIIESFFTLYGTVSHGMPLDVSLGHPSSVAGTSETPSAANGRPVERQSPTMSSTASTFVKFAENHRSLINAFIRNQPMLLTKCSFRQLLRLPRLLDFDNKRAFFVSMVKGLSGERSSGMLRVRIRRSHVLEDSFQQLRMHTPVELRGKLAVQFSGEEGIDAGGLTREWYTILCREIFNVSNALFLRTNEGTFQPNQNSQVNPDHLAYFRFAGRIVGKALYDGQLLDVHFTRSLYKHMLGMPIVYQDMEAIDPDYYKNLKWMLENDITDVLDLSFTAEADEFAAGLFGADSSMAKMIELKPNGANIPVTEENKAEYVSLITQHRMTTAIKQQIEEYLKGFHDLIPKQLISIFNDKELELLISGLPEIDLDDLQSNTEYHGFTAASPVIQWFWKSVRGFDREDLARFLQFCTGTSKVPLEGFKALQGISGPQKFQVHKAYGAVNRLPAAHTCFNQLDLPEYESEGQLKDRLLLAIHECTEGFGFG